MTLKHEKYFTLFVLRAIFVIESTSKKERSFWQMKLGKGLISLRNEFLIKSSHEYTYVVGHI